MQGLALPSFLPFMSFFTHNPAVVRSQPFGRPLCFTGGGIFIPVVNCYNQLLNTSQLKGKLQWVQSSNEMITDFDYW